MSSDKDSKRSWMVAVVTFVLMFLENGVVKSLGVLLPDIREQFATKTWVVGLAIAFVPGLGSVVCEYIIIIKNIKYVDSEHILIHPSK